jgi:hypothetical protein
MEGLAPAGASAAPPRTKELPQRQRDTRPGSFKLPLGGRQNLVDAERDVLEGRKGQVLAPTVTRDVCVAFRARLPVHLEVPSPGRDAEGANRVQAARASLSLD